MRLRVKIKNAKECRTELSFPDLSVKFNNGYAPSLKIKEGEEIPLDVLDPEDVRKSLKVGSLKGYLENGWVEEFTEPLPPEVVSHKFVSNFIKEQDIKSSPAIEVPLPQPILPEVTKEVEKKPISVPPSEQITDLTKVFSYEDFCKLSHFLRLRFIKETGDINLLKEIAGKTPSAQFKNNINLRLSQI